MGYKYIVILYKTTYKHGLATYIIQICVAAVLNPATKTQLCVGGSETLRGCDYCQSLFGRTRLKLKAVVQVKHHLRLMGK